LSNANKLLPNTYYLYAVSYCQDFLLPNAVVTFFVHLCSPALQPGHGEETIERNAVNDEQLIVRPWMDSSLLIARCPAQVNAEWLAEKMEALKTFDFYSLKRGLILLKPSAVDAFSVGER
jgi:hypothetical protein